MREIMRETLRKMMREIIRKTIRKMMRETVRETMWKMMWKMMRLNQVSAFSTSYFVMSLLLCFRIWIWVSDLYISHCPDEEDESDPAGASEGGCEDTWLLWIKQNFLLTVSHKPRPSDLCLDKDRLAVYFTVSVVKNKNKNKTVLTIFQ